MSETEETSKCLQIQGPEYVLRNDSGFLWDLYLLKVVNKGKPNQKYEYKSAGYGLSLERCVRKIIGYRVKLRSKNLKQGDKDLITLLKMWMEEKTKLLSLFNLNEEEWSKVSNLKRIPLDKLVQRDLIDADIASDEDDEETED